MADILFEGGKFYCTGDMAVNIFIHTQQFGRPHAGDYKIRIQSCIRAYHKACTHD